jgi:hypothetical protein
MCVHDPDGSRGWTGECPDSGRCLCGYFPEVGPAFPKPRAPTHIARTFFRIIGGIVLVLLALLTLGVWFIQPEDERPHRYS